MSSRNPHYVNPYAAQNSRVVGARFLEEVAPNRPLPGIPPADGKVYIPLDMIRTRGPYRDDDDGWTKVVNKRARRYRRNGGWVGSSGADVSGIGSGTN